MKEREILILAALLHDIGKFLQRAEISLTPEYKNLEGIFCPSHSRLHLLYSAQFVKNIFGEKGSFIENLVLSHHNPDAFSGDKRISKIIVLADWLSSAEREDEEEKIGGTYKEKPLITPFSEIHPPKTSNPENTYYNLTCLKTDEGITPYKPKPFYRISNEYKELYEKFEKEIGVFQSRFTRMDVNSIIEKILFLLEKYTLFIPSYTQNPTISLYHHLKTTAAIATCLYDTGVPENEMDGVIEDFRNNSRFPSNKEKRFAFIVGDITGIQNFIYSLISEGALKSLRGRSFYVQMLSEITARKVLKEFNLTLCNLIFCGGGNFLILAPNIEKLEEKLNEISQSIDSILFKAHKGKLGIVLTCSSFSYDGFKKVLSSINSKLAEEKRKKFKTIISTPDFFKEEIHSLKGSCKICQEELETGEICELCKSFEDLSNKLIRGKYLKLTETSNSFNGKFQNWETLFSKIGYKMEIKDDYIPSSYIINTTDFLKDDLKGFRFEGNYVPTKDGKTLTLEEIAEKSLFQSKDEKGNQIFIGIKRWGVLRMDVDNLGKIFSEWFQKPSISKYSFLSYMLSLFFSFGIYSIVKNEYPDCMIVYSGGDDLCIIGPWNKLPELAQKINDEFKEYVKNKYITLSAGIYIVPSEKFPVYQAVKEAGDLENIAKYKDKDKNKICFLSEEGIGWDTFKEVEEIKNYILNLLEPATGKNKAPRALLNILYRAYAEELKVKSGKTKISKIWLLAYGIKRLFERIYRDDKDKQINEAMELINKLVKDYNLKKEVLVAIRWAELLTRKVKGGQNEQ